MYGKCRYGQCEMTSVRPPSQHPNISNPRLTKNGESNHAPISPSAPPLQYRSCCFVITNPPLPLLPVILAPADPPATLCGAVPQECNPEREFILWKCTETTGESSRQVGFTPLSFFPPRPQLLFLLLLVVMTDPYQLHPHILSKSHFDIAKKITFLLREVILCAHCRHLCSRKHISQSPTLHLPRAAEITIPDICSPLLSAGAALARRRLSGPPASSFACMLVSPGY